VGNTFEPDGEYAEPWTLEIFSHIAIITEVTGTDPEYWGVISCSGLVEVFEWGVSETKLGAFQNTTDVGLFDWWTFPLNYRIYTNRD